MDNEALIVIIHYLGVAFGRAFHYKSSLVPRCGLSIAIP